MDDRPDGIAPAPGESSRKPPGPEPTYLDERGRSELLRLIGEGKGIDQALRSLEISYRAYQNTARVDTAYRAEIASARRSYDQSFDEFGHLKAMADDGNTEILLRIWERRDKARDLNRSREDRQAERAEERADRLAREEADRKERDKDRALRLHLAELNAAQREKERLAKAGEGDSDGNAAPDFTRLTPEQLATWREQTRQILGTGDDPT